MLGQKRKELMLDNSPSNVEDNGLGEDGWVLVKKQRVRIHIPPLHFSENDTSNVQDETPAFEDHSRDLVAVNDDKPLPCPTRDDQFHIQVISPELEPGFEARPTKPKARKLRIPSRMGASRLRGSVVDAPKLPHISLDRMLRASNLERKLQRAGGLNTWLASLGLEQFIKVFQEWNVSKFQLVNLSMKKLKDMGAYAVGPRRKLMHAIDCVCQPYCFELV